MDPMELMARLREMSSSPFTKMIRISFVRWNMMSEVVLEAQVGSTANLVTAVLEEEAVRPLPGREYRRCRRLLQG
jgi:hypothetical protein